MISPSFISALPFSLPDDVPIQRDLSAHKGLDNLIDAARLYNSNVLAAIVSSALRSGPRQKSLFDWRMVNEPDYARTRKGNEERKPKERGENEKLTSNFNWLPGVFRRRGINREWTSNVCPGATCNRNGSAPARGS
jgi:hypothetical protein